MPTLHSIPAHEYHSPPLTTILTARYAGRYPAEHVAAVVADAHHQLAGARIQTFVPLLAERLAREVLDRPLRSVSLGAATPPSVATPQKQHLHLVRRWLRVLVTLVTTPLRRKSGVRTDR